MVVYNVDLLSNITSAKDVSYNPSFSSSWTTDAVAEYDIDISMIMNVFQFKSTVVDISNILIKNDASENTTYYVNASQWDASAIINPFHARMKTNEIGGDDVNSFAPEKRLVKHDFMRYLAEKIFGYYYGLDFIANEDEVRESLADTGHTLFYGSTMVVINDASSQSPFTNASTSNVNITRQLITTIVDNSISRLTGLNDGNINSVPFQIGDVLRFKVRCSAPDNQHDLTKLVDAIPERTYQIDLNLKSATDVNNTIPTDSITDTLKSSYVH